MFIARRSSNSFPEPTSRSAAGSRGLEAEARHNSFAWPVFAGAVGWAWLFSCGWSGQGAHLGEVCRVDEELELTTAGTYPAANRADFLSICGLLTHPLQHGLDRVQGCRGARANGERQPHAIPES